MSRVQSRAGAAAVLGSLLLVACAQTPPRPPGVPVAVELGPVIRLLDVPTSHERVHALIDELGLAHVVVASPRTRTLRYLAVDSTGAITLDEVIRSDITAASVDAAFDATGQLHVLAGRQHYLRERSGQWSEAATPWAAAGLDTGAPCFVPGADRDRPLLYAFDVRGKDVGAPARWDLFGFGGYGAGIVWPWRTRGSRLAVVEEDGGRYDAWSVIDLDGEESVADWRVIAEPGGRVHVVYDAQRTMLATQSLARHACVEPATSAGASSVREIAGRRVRSVPGAPVPMKVESPAIGMSAAIGFAAATRELLLVREHAGGRVFRNGEWGSEVPWPLELAWEPRVAPTAVDRFDVVVTGTRGDSTAGHDRPVLYLQFRDGRWSAPVEVGGAKVGSLFGTMWDAVQIASDGHERVLVTWPVPAGIEARWLRVPVSVGLTRRASPAVPPSPSSPSRTTASARRQPR